MIEKSTERIVNTPTAEPVMEQSLDLILAGSDSAKAVATADILAWARMMARHSYLPAHLRWVTDPEQTVANCFRIVSQARTWKMDPYFVAQHTYEKGGNLHYDGLIIAAVINLSAKLTGRLSFVWSGVGAAMRGTVTGTLRGGKAPLSCEVTPWTASTRSKAWDTDPVNMLWYRGVRQWARLYLPEIYCGLGESDDDGQLPQPGDAVSVEGTPVSTVSIAEAQRLSALSMRQSGSTDAPTPPPPLPTPVPQNGVAPATLQDALAEMHAAAAVAAGGGQDNYHQMWGNLLATRDSYFALVGWVDTDQHSYGPERSAAWDKMLAKRGVTALLPAPVEVIRELAGALELKIVELAQARKDQGVTCVPKEAPATQPAKKSVESGVGRERADKPPF